jgi:hypothetical protein
MILESGLVAASNTDLLAGGRLNAIPYNGRLTLQVLADSADSTNNYTITIQKPNGDVPVDGQLVPGANPSLAGVLDDRQLLQFTFAATVGGHFTVSLVETGAATVIWRAVLKP